jgi:glycosyltransferase involved in cell wall biosynthesis
MDLVIPAFAKIKAKYLNARLLIVGDGNIKEQMMQQAKDLGVNDSVLWLGRQPQSELEKFYDQIDILLMPSRSEGFGLTAIEGMARGCVVVASNAGGLPEVVTKGVGLIHQLDSIDDITEKVVSLVEHPEQYVQYSLNALKRAGDFNFQRYAASYQSLYSKLN